MSQHAQGIGQRVQGDTVRSETKMFQNVLSQAQAAQCVFMISMGLRRWMRSPNMSSATWWSLSKRLDLDLQGGIFIELAVKHTLANEDPLVIGVQRKEVTEEPKRLMTREMARRFSLFEEVLFLRHGT